MPSSSSGSGSLKTRLIYVAGALAVTAVLGAFLALGAAAGVVMAGMSG